MKRIVPVAAFLLSVLMVLFSAPAMEAAKDALTLWWQAVLPTLFPFFVCASILERTGGLHALAKLFFPLSKRLSLSPWAIPVVLLGSISGYPSGARITGMLLEKGRVTGEEAQRLGTVGNLCSPMFLMGALCYGMLGNAALFGALCLGHYGSALLVILILRLLRPVKPSAMQREKPNPEPLRLALPAAIGEGMTGLIRVGGSIVFFLVLVRLLGETGILHVISLPLSLVSEELGLAVPGLLSGILEFTGGCHLLAEADIGQRLCAALCAFLVSFGGLSVMVQAMAFLPYPQPLSYLGTKLFQGILAGLLVWFAFPFLPGDVAAMAGPSGISPYTVNALTGLSLLFASLLGVAVAMVLAALGGLVKPKGR